MLPQVAARKLLDSLHAPPGAVTVWPWHEDDGRVTMIVVVNSHFSLDETKIPKNFEGFRVRVERQSPPVVRAASAN
jgi:hypothetical protein